MNPTSNSSPPGRLLVGGCEFDGFGVGLEVIDVGVSSKYWI